MANIVFDEFDYQGWLVSQFTNIIVNIFELDINFKISEEQQFISDKNKEPDTLYIVYKQLVGPTSYNVKSAPYQLYIMSEENQLESAKAIANKFVEINNFATNHVGNTLIKHAYSQPSVLSNFNQVNIGVRSIIYIPTTLQMMAGLNFLKYGDNYGTISVFREGWTDRVDIKYMGLSLSYSMVGDTQQFPDNEIAKTIKSTATASLSFSIPLYNNDFCNDLLKLLVKSGDNLTQLAGDTTFNFQFNLGNIPLDLDMKCISLQLEDAPDQAPGLRIGFML